VCHPLALLYKCLLFRFLLIEQKNVKAIRFIYLLYLLFFRYTFSWMTSTKIYAITYWAKQNNQSGNAETSYINVWAHSITNTTQQPAINVKEINPRCRPGRGVVCWTYLLHWRERWTIGLTHPPAVPEILFTPVSEETAQSLSDGWTSTNTRSPGKMKSGNPSHDARGAA